MSYSWISPKGRALSHRTEAGVCRRSGRCFTSREFISSSRMLCVQRWQIKATFQNPTLKRRPFAHAPALRGAPRPGALAVHLGPCVRITLRWTSALLLNLSVRIYKPDVIFTSQHYTQSARHPAWPIASLQYKWQPRTPPFFGSSRYSGEKHRYRTAVDWNSSSPAH